MGILIFDIKARRFSDIIPFDGPWYNYVPTWVEITPDQQYVFFLMWNRQGSGQRELIVYDIIDFPRFRLVPNFIHYDKISWYPMSAVRISPDGNHLLMYAIDADVNSKVTIIG